MDLKTKWWKYGCAAFGILALAITTCLSVTISSAETTSTVETLPSSLPEDNTNKTHNCSVFCRCPTFNTSTTTDYPTTRMLRLCNSTDECGSLENATVECNNSAVNCSQMVNNVTEVCNITTGLCQNVIEDINIGCINETKCSQTRNNATLACNATAGACMNESEVKVTPTDGGVNCINDAYPGEEDGVELCNTANGHCLYGCQSGYARPTCEITCGENCSECVHLEESNKPICTLCEYHFYRRSNRCVPCPKNCLQGTESEPTCRREDGECVFGCQSGYYGSLCDQNCTLICDPYECSRHDGCCLRGCRREQYCGCTCNKPCGFACRYQQCSLNCSCLNGCIAGFYGISCGNRCGDNCVKSEIKDVSSCDQTNGRCLKGCIENMWWGDRCEKSCSSECKNGTCIMEYGTCTDGCTSANWFSHDCSERCNEHCVENLCLQSTGDCIRGCEEGWYGQNCSRKCNENCFNETCERETGTCIYGCKDGFYGNNCGHDCNEHCKNITCEFVSGNCTNGCVAGWIPPRCEDREFEFLCIIIITIIIYKDFLPTGR